MTIDEAIEILNDIKDTDPELYGDDEQNALQLGIEALKREKALREAPGHYPITPLLGEAME